MQSRTPALWLKLVQKQTILPARVVVSGFTYFFFIRARLLAGTAVTTQNIIINFIASDFRDFCLFFKIQCQHYDVISGLTENTFKPKF